MRTKFRAAGALCAALALTAACTDDPGSGSGSEDPAVGEDFDEDRLVTMVNEGNRLLSELESAEQRIILGCLEREGFTVHDQFWFEPVAPAEEVKALYDEGDWGTGFPSAEEAAMYGLGSWAWSTEGASDPDLQAYYDYAGLALGDDADDLESDVDLPDNSAFEALAPEDQYAWAVAYFGEAAAIDEYGYLLGEDAPEPPDATGDEEIDLGGDFDYVAPEPGGCQREMIDALYDGLELVEDPDEDQEYRSANWSWRPANPIDDAAVTEAADLAYQQALAPVNDELVTCLEGKGRTGWEFGEDGYLPLSDYFTELYEGEADAHDHPDLPADAPADYEGKKAFEIAFAVDLAACDDETGYGEAEAEEWAASRNDMYLSIEVATYAWQDEIRASLVKAQEVLEA